MEIDIETLGMLLFNFGIIGLRYYKKPIYLDTPLSSSDLQVQYCGSEVTLQCRNKTKFNLAILEQNL